MVRFSVVSPALSKLCKTTKNGCCKCHKVFHYFLSGNIEILWKLQSGRIISLSIVLTRVLGGCMNSDWINAEVCKDHCTVKAGQLVKLSIIHTLQTRPVQALVEDGGGTSTDKGDVQVRAWRCLFLWVLMQQCIQRKATWWSNCASVGQYRVLFLLINKTLLKTFQSS